MKAKNQKNLEKLIKRLQGTVARDIYWEPFGEDAFNMSLAQFDCGSPACIAGHAADLAGERWKSKSYRMSLAEFLGVNRRIANDLWTGKFANKPAYGITPQDAIAYLETLRE